MIMFNSKPLNYQRVQFQKPPLGMVHDAAVVPENTACLKRISQLMDYDNPQYILRRKKNELINQPSFISYISYIHVCIPKLWWLKITFLAAHGFPGATWELLGWAPVGGRPGSRRRHRPWKAGRLISGDRRWRSGSVYIYIYWYWYDDPHEPKISDWDFGDFWMGFMDLLLGVIKAFARSLHWVLTWLCSGKTWLMVQDAMGNNTMDEKKKTHGKTNL